MLEQVFAFPEAVPPRSVSTSQIVSSAIIGVGSSERVSKVRWSVAEEIVTAWLITIPASAMLLAGFYGLIGLLSR